MSQPCNILILGASYGSLLGIKLAMAGHRVTVVCLPGEVELINREGIRVRLPLKGRKELVELDSRRYPGLLKAAGPADVSPVDYDLVCLAMQEPQYRSPGVHELLDAVATSRAPCMSIMNMPPLPYLARLPGVSTKACRSAYTDPTVWDHFVPACMTLCSPDPQAFRPPEEPANVLQVRLPTNFKAARFESEAHSAMLHRLQADIEAIRYEVDGQSVELPVKLKVHDSVFVPLAKWSMLMTGNYRCVTPQGMRPIREAVHSDLATSREVYHWVSELCKSMGAGDEDLVPFEKYAAAAQGLTSPSSAARALYGGAHYIERVDRLVQAIAALKGQHHPIVDEVVALVDVQLDRNRAVQK
jgi:hypothetical protein